jgi:hypothetical protein
MPCLSGGKGISSRPTSTDKCGPNASARTKHSAQWDDPNKHHCPNASACTHFGLRFGPKMRRPGQRARPPERPSYPPLAQPTEAPRHFPTPPLCCPAARAFLLSPRRRCHDPRQRCHGPPPVPTCCPNQQKRPSFHLSRRPPRATAGHPFEDHHWVS